MKKYTDSELTIVKWSDADMQDKIPERFQATLALTQEDPTEILPQLIREYIESVEEDSEIINESEAALKGTQVHDAETVIGRFHYLRSHARVRRLTLMGYADERWQEILDGRKCWNKNDHAKSDSDVFYTQFVLPLRDLRDRGYFDGLHEYRGFYPGSTKVDRIDIKGAINLES